MPRVSTEFFVPVGTYCNPETRKRVVAPEHCAGNHVVAVAKNAIRNFTQTVHRLHLVDAIIGDINDNNVLINPADGFISVIDCDSFQYTDPASRRSFPCLVGRAEYTAPELLHLLDVQCRRPECDVNSGPHRASYACVQRTKDHDLFAMAVVVFKLLMDGTHPYDCIVSGSSAHEVNTLKDRIAARYFPYGPRKPANIRPADHNRTRYDRLPQQIRELFEQAFA